MPKLLYKYLTVKRALACLPEIGDGALRATPPTALNDPLECHIWKGFIDLDIDAGNARFAEILTKLHELGPVTPVEVAEARRDYGSLYMRELLARQMSKRFGIVSFAEVPFHPLMWSHYTTDSSGFVVGYEAERLRTLASTGDGLRKVRYSPRPEIIQGYPRDLASEVYEILCVKSSHWNYENEWRLVVELTQTVGTGAQDSHEQPINLLCIPNSAVAKVYYTERTPMEAVQKIARRLASANNRYKAKHGTKLVLSENTYGYTEAK